MASASRHLRLGVRWRSGSGPSVAMRWPPEPPTLRAAMLPAGAMAACGALFGPCWWPLAEEFISRSFLPAGSSLRPVLIIAAYLTVCLVVGLFFVGWNGRLSSLQVKASLGLTSAPGRGFVASPVLGVYHKPQCPQAATISARNRVWITHAYEAGAGGFRPCKLCAPVFS
jgi:hypothetical protein